MYDASASNLNDVLDLLTRSIICCLVDLIAQPNPLTSYYEVRVHPPTGSGSSEVGVVMTSYIIRRYEMTNRRPAFTKILGLHGYQSEGASYDRQAIKYDYGLRKFKSTSRMNHTINYNLKTTHNFSMTAMARNNT